MRTIQTIHDKGFINKIKIIWDDFELNFYKRKQKTSCICALCNKEPTLKKTI